MIRYVVAFILTIFLALAYWLLSGVPSQSYSIKKTETSSSNSNIDLDANHTKEVTVLHQKQQNPEFLGVFLDPDKDFGTGSAVDISLGELKSPDDIVDYISSSSAIAFLGQEKDPDRINLSEGESKIRHVGEFKEPYESDSERSSPPRHIGEYLDPSKTTE